MAVNLTKGGRVNLSKVDGLSKAMVGLGWDINRYQGDAEFDLDLVLFETSGSPSKVIDDEHFVYYNGPITLNDGSTRDPEGAIMHSPDNRTGEGDGDDESAVIEFAKLNPSVTSIVIAVTIYDAKANNQNFGMVDNAYIRLVNHETGEEVLRYDLSEDFSIQTSVVFAEIYNKNNQWMFKAVGQGYDKELIDLCREYGVNV